MKGLIYKKGQRVFESLYEKDPVCDYELGKVYRILKENGEKVEVGSKRKDGYLEFGFEGKLILCHRYLYQKYHNIKLKKGEEINHKNHERSDNRIDNLEVLSRQNNCQYRENSKGYSWNKKLNKFEAYINFNKKIHLGLYDNENDARIAFITKAKELNEKFGCKYNV